MKNRPTQDSLLDDPPLNVWYSSGENAALSNLSYRPFRDQRGRLYVSVEHAYQSWKSGKFDAETYAKYDRGGQKIRGRWPAKTEGGFNLDLMRRMMLASFRQNPEAASRLLDTGDRLFSHRQDRGAWRLEFPRLLAEVRAALRAEPAVSPPEYRGDTFGVVPVGQGDFSGMRGPGGRHMNSPGIRPFESGWIGNPHSWSGNGGPSDVGLSAAIAAFRQSFLKKIQVDAVFRSSVEALRGRSVEYYRPQSRNHLEVIMEWLAMTPPCPGQVDGDARSPRVRKIISGGQTGGDMGGLLAARVLGLETGGSLPKGGRREGAPWSSEAMRSFGLVEHLSSGYPGRTMQNVDDADATIAFLWGRSVGTLKTIGYAQTGVWGLPVEPGPEQVHRPCLVVRTKDLSIAAGLVRHFLSDTGAEIVNIAGHRESTQPGVERFVKTVLVHSLSAESPRAEVRPGHSGVV